MKKRRKEDTIEMMGFDFEFADLASGRRM